jgi:hypothetical protein
MNFPPFSLSQRTSSLVLLAALVTGSTLLTACDDDDNVNPQVPSVTYGAPVAMGGGSARTYVSSDASGNPTEVGIRMTDTALDNLPPTPVTGTMYDLALPTAAGQTPFDHVSFDWNPKGHDPSPTYAIPHFDAHFYMQSTAAQHTIAPDDPKGDIVPDTALFLPTGYLTPPNVVPGRTVPMMGRHWVDKLSPENLPGGVFGSTFIYGSYDGHVTFLEPMFVKSMLTPSVNFTDAVKQPKKYEVPGKYYPTRYFIRYDAATKEYVIALTELVKR